MTLVHWEYGTGGLQSHEMRFLKPIAFILLEISLERRHRRDRSPQVQLRECLRWFTLEGRLVLFQWH